MAAADAKRGHVDCDGYAIRSKKEQVADHLGNPEQEIVMNLRFVAIAAAATFIAGCNTMHGVGEDISAGGRKVEDVLKKDKPASGSNVNTPSTPDAAPRTSDTSMSRIPTDTSTQ